MPAPSKTLSILGLLAIIAGVTLGLIAIVRLMPDRPAKPVVVEPNNIPIIINTDPKKQACDQAGGKWTECGSPCHGKPGEVCVMSCEPQCLCGGDAQWSCPKNLACSDYATLVGQNAKVGVCRSTVSTSTAVVIPTPTTTIPVATSTAATITGMLCDRSNSICVSADKGEMALTNPIMVTGTARVFENQVSWKLTYLSQGQEQVYAEGFTMADSPDTGEPGEFAVRAFLPWLNLAKPPSQGTLTVYEVSAKDGSPTHEVKIPVRIPATVKTVTLYFPDSAQPQSCTAMKAHQVKMVNSSLPIESLLRRLLEVDSSSEEAGTDVTAIPDRTTLVSFVLDKNGVARVELGGGITAAAGSCAVQAIRSQIEANLKQFPSVKSVEIKEQGLSVAESLQP